MRVQLKSKSLPTLCLAFARLQFRAPDGVMEPLFSYFFFSCSISDSCLLSIQGQIKSHEVVFVFNRSIDDTGWCDNVKDPEFRY